MLSGSCAFRFVGRLRCTAKWGVHTEDVPCGDAENEFSDAVTVQGVSELLLVNNNICDEKE